MTEYEWECLETAIQHSDTFNCMAVKYYELVKQEDQAEGLLARSCKEKQQFSSLST